MPKAKARKRFPEVSLQTAMCLWREEEVKRINKLVAKLTPLMKDAKHDVVRSFRDHNDLKLWRLPDRKLNVHDNHRVRRYIDMNGMLRWEVMDRVFNPPLPVIVGATYIHPWQLSNWRKDLEKLRKKLQKQ